MNERHHLRYANLSAQDQLFAAREILQGHSGLMDRLALLEESGLQDSWIVAGALYGNIWNALTGRPWDYGVKDYDIFYFDDRDVSYAAEDDVIQCWTPRFPLHPPVEIRNQARVHLWYEDHFGVPYPPLSDVEEAITRFACLTHMIGARVKNGALEIVAPRGLNALFSFQLIGNTARDNRATHETKAVRHCKLWPELECVPWGQ